MKLSNSAEKEIDADIFTYVAVCETENLPSGQFSRIREPRFREFYVYIRQFNATESEPFRWNSPACHVYEVA